MNSAILMEDILEKLADPRDCKLQISLQRREELFSNSLSDIEPWELNLIRIFLNIYKIDFIEKYEIPEHLMKIEGIEEFKIIGKQVNEYFNKP